MGPILISFGKAWACNQFPRKRIFGLIPKSDSRHNVVERDVFFVSGVCSSGKQEKEKEKYGS